MLLKVHKQSLLRSTEKHVVWGWQQFYSQWCCMLEVLIILLALLWIPYYGEGVLDGPNTLINMDVPCYPLGGVPKTGTK